MLNKISLLHIQKYLFYIFAVDLHSADLFSYFFNTLLQGTLPHGIDILTKTDYYEVGKRKNTYLNLR